MPKGRGNKWALETMFDDCNFYWGKADVSALKASRNAAEWG
jgi:hypothetical protein